MINTLVLTDDLIEDIRVFDEIATRFMHETLTTMQCGKVPLPPPPKPKRCRYCGSIVHGDKCKNCGAEV